MGMTAYNPDGTVASVFQGIERDGNKLVLKQLALGQVPMDVIITPEEGLKLTRKAGTWTCALRDCQR